MKSNVESRLKNYEQNVQKFESRWNQLKPSDALLDDDPSAGDQAVQMIKEKKQEFEELEATREALEYASYECLSCVIELLWDFVKNEGLYSFLTNRIFVWVIYLSVCFLFLWSYF